MENDGAQIYPVDRCLALERSTDAIAIVRRFWSSEILSKSAVFDELNSSTALYEQGDRDRALIAYPPVRAMLTLQANNGRSRPARVCARCGALRRMGDRVNDHLEERVVEIVTWKCLDRLRHEVLRQIVESPSDNIDTGSGSRCRSRYEARWRPR
jgi:predicted dithiol-disulfide oxidoreductase (DUF899 family)